MLLGLLLLFPLFPLQAQAQSDPMPVRDYLALLETLQAQLETDPSTATLQEMQRRLQAERQIRLSDATVMDIQPLLGDPQEALPTVDIAQQRLALLIAQLEAAPTDHVAERLALLETILQRREFIGQDSLWDRFWRWVRSLLPDTAEATPNTDTSLVANGVTLLGWLVLGVGAILLIYLLSFWLQNLLGSFAFGMDRARQGNPTDEPHSAAEARQQAHQLAADGSYREAVRRMYLSALLTLDEHALLHYERSNTNREVLATVRTNQPLYTKLQPIVDIFDEVWYGIHEPDRTTFDEYVQAVEQLQRTDEAGTASPAQQRSERTGADRQ